MINRVSRILIVVHLYCCSKHKSTALHLGIAPLLVLHLFLWNSLPLTYGRTSSSVAILKKQLEHFSLGKLLICWNSANVLRF